MDQAIRNKLRNVVTQCRKLLEDAISSELEGTYSIFAKKDQVTADPNAAMSHLSEEKQASRRDILDHFAHIKARGFKSKETLDQLVREIAFTHLNRLCAYKMMEAREVYVGGQKFREAVSRGVNSNGVKFYLADHEDDERLYNTGQQDVAYRHFLDWLGGALSEEIGVLFNPNDPANRLYPRQKTLDEILDLLNGGGIKAEETELREQWPKIWAQDETIGWVYQYFTPKELRDQARKESSAPRNSYELAFRNQFFTPRYVVEFLTDNTLGRTWYEMLKGDTKLKDQCRYLVRRPTEIFLKEGEQPPKDSAEGRNDLSQEELLKLPVHIPHRPKKDPRELKILDPACGSGHFLLYCFDLLLTIYEEAYADFDLGPALQQDYPKLEDLRRDVPRLILAHNLHGIDIDLRASQIAALALWLRCQRAYQDMGLKKDRPKITRSNFVCAEPMPGENQMLREFVGQLEPKLLGQLVEVVFDKMNLAGEAGSLLRIEEEIRNAVAQARKQWLAGPISIQKSLFDNGQPFIQQRFDFSGITDAQFFGQAEAKVIEALRSYAEKAQNGQRFKRRLFTEDTVRGFAFIDLCQKKYNVVLMNPPFGEPTNHTQVIVSRTLELCGNMFSSFVVRGQTLLANQGFVGTITDRSFVVKETYEEYRIWLYRHSSPLFFIDLGWEVLDANVEACAYIVSKASESNPGLFSNLATETPESVAKELARRVELLRGGCSSFVLAYTKAFERLPHRSMSYWLPPSLLSDFLSGESLESIGGKPGRGMSSGNTAFACRLLWEVPPHLIGSHKKWNLVNVGGGKAPFFRSPFMVFYHAADWQPMKKFPGFSLKNTDLFWKPAIGWGKRTDVLSVQLIPNGMITAEDGQVFLPHDLEKIWTLLGFLNSKYAQTAIHCICGGHKGPGYLGKIPFRTQIVNSTVIGNLARRGFLKAQEISQCDETTAFFVSPFYFASNSEWASRTLKCISNLTDEVNLALREIDSAVFDGLGKSSFDIAQIESVAPGQLELTVDWPENESDLMKSVASYSVGAAFGRWDIRKAKCGSQKLGFSDPFDSLPICCPGMLQDDKFLPAKKTPQDYSLRISWDGIIADDPGHTDDIVRRMQEVLELIWIERTNFIEKDVCRILGVKELREYFRKPGKGSFWDDHISRYSKSRRKAPIYWLLQSSKKNYALWLYYHRLDKDLLFKALVNYVEPKIRLETSRLETLRRQKSTTGDSGKEAKRLAKDAEKQEDFLSELRDFEDKLRRAANLHLEPDLNDGVVLNIAPLHELVPWKEAKNYWNELIVGKYEWSAISQQLRQKGLVKC